MLDVNLPGSQSENLIKTQQQANEMQSFLGAT